MQENSDISKNAKIYENNFIINSKIEDDVVLYPNNVIINSTIKRGSVIYSSQIEGSVVGNNCFIGPNAHLRPDCEIDDGVKIGNFVEIKNSKIGSKSKVAHLTYIGDSVVGKNCNFGCGVVVCNFDGKQKHKTTIGDNVFVGSNANLIAPIKIGDNCFIAAGSTITKDLQPNCFSIERAEQKIKPKRE